MKFLLRNRKYLGNKTKLMGKIWDVVKPFIKKDWSNVLDIFGGTGAAGEFFLQKGFNVKINDFLKSNYTIYDAFFGKEKISKNKIASAFSEIHLEVERLDKHWFSKKYGGKYFSHNDAAEIATIREYILKSKLNNREKNILIASLIYSADRAANSMGHYDIYITRKIDDKFNFRLIDFDTNRKMTTYCQDANHLIENIETDILYLDPPYNSRQYSNLYHVLETLTIWKEPKEFFGKSLKNREVLKQSKYSLTEATEAMLDLISKAKTKLIVVSYNNFKSSNSRSQSKISLQDLILILETRGKVTLKKIPYKMYASNNKKSNISKYEELVLVCEVKKPTIEKRFVRYPFNYMGGKYKIIEELIEAFPKKINNFYDMFAGGANVSVNVEAKHIHINEVNSHQLEILKTFYNTPTFKMLKLIEGVIGEYGLSFSGKIGVKNYESSNFKEYNRDSFNKLRGDFNETNDIYKFIVLVIYSFNNTINFNLNGGFNIPGGKRDFNKTMLLNFIQFSKKIRMKKVSFYNLDFRDFKIEKLKNNVIYMDPPYLITYAHYNKNWTEKEEVALLDIFSKNNAFLSNVIASGSKKNLLLREFLNKNDVINHTVQTNYDNSWFHKKEKGNFEILIENKIVN